MAVADLVRPLTRTKPTVDQVTEARIKRGRDTRDKAKPVRELCQQFYENNHYAYLNPKTGAVQFKTPGDVGIVAPDKPANRVRKVVPKIASIVEGKVSACTQSMPGYEVDPAKNDQDSRQAAAMSEQVARYGFDQWRVRGARKKVVINAIVQREGFAVPFFDDDLGKRNKDGDAEGDIRILTFTRDQVSWEPGEDFEDSRWYALERNLRPERVEAMPGFIGGVLEMPNGERPTRVNVVEFLERPSRKYPKGRRFYMVDGRVIVDYRNCADCPVGWTDWWEPYPVIDAKGDVLDEPYVHRLVYTVNPSGEDMGLVERLIDPQRTLNDCANKISEWKNRALVPQMIAPIGSRMNRLTDVPGAINEYAGQTPPQWERVPPIPQELFQLYELTTGEMESMAADVQVAAQARLSADTAQAAVEQGASRWASFLGDLAEFDSRLMRHCLLLVARFYSEPRKIDIRGQYGWESVQTFTGTDLMSQINVRVGAESLSQTTRLQRQQMVQFLQANFPGAVSAESALAYIEGGVAAGLLKSYELQFARVWRIVKQIMSGTLPQALGDWEDPTTPNLAAAPVPMPSGPPDPLTGQPTIVWTAPMGASRPNYMPAPWDNIDIWRKVVGDTMCTEAFERQPEHVRNAMHEMWFGLDFMEQDRAAKMAAQQEMQAQSLGMNNAAAPQVAPPLPDRAGFTPGSNESSVPTAEPAAA